VCQIDERKDESGNQITLLVRGCEDGSKVFQLAAENGVQVRSYHPEMLDSKKCSCALSEEAKKMGISPIEYHAWKGERTAQNLRLYVIARSVFRHKIRSLGVIILLVIGFLIVHAFSLITIILMSHEELKAPT